MTSQEHREVREWLGAYVLGHLSAQEAARLEAHLFDCALCRAERAELLPVAGALDEVRRGLRTSGPDPDLALPPELGARVLAAVEHDQRRTHWAQGLRTAVIAGAAAVSAAALVLAGVRLGEEPAPAIPFEAVAVTESDPAVQASAGVVPHTWGVEVKLTASGFRQGERYVVTVQGAGGRDYPAGEFVGTGDKEMTCNLNSSVLRARAAGFEVRDRAGDVVVASRF